MSLTFGDREWKAWSAPTIKKSRGRSFGSTKRDVYATKIQVCYT